MDRRYYVYGYIRLDTNTYFYIGKGTDIRYKRTDIRTKHFKNILNSTECAVEILYDNLTEEEALDYEMQVIDELLCEEGYTIEFDKDEYKNHGFNHLVNCTYGGEGISGYKYTEEQRAKCSRPGEQNGMYGRRGELNPNFGIHHTKEHDDKIRLNNPRSKAVYCTELDREFDSCRQASKIIKEEYGIICYHSGISKVCEGKREYCGYYIDTKEEAKLHFIKL